MLIPLWRYGSHGGPVRVDASGFDELTGTHPLLINHTRHRYRRTDESILQTKGGAYIAGVNHGQGDHVRFGRELRLRR